LRKNLGKDRLDLLKLLRGVDDLRSISCGLIEWSTALLFNAANLDVHSYRLAGAKSGARLVGCLAVFASVLSNTKPRCAQHRGKRDVEADSAQPT